MEGSGEKGSGRSGFSRRRFSREWASPAWGRSWWISRCRGGGAATGRGRYANKPISGNIDIVLNVNGRDRKVTVEPRTTLLNALQK